MEKDVDYVRLVKRARLGDKQSLESLTELAEKRLRVDVYRLTLQRELTEEIVQESLFEMFRVLKELKEADRFWPWLYKIALNKLRLHHRKERRLKTVLLSAVAEGNSQKDNQEVVANAISQEVKEIIFVAMRVLKPRQRAVLTMRCYREMEYSDIAESMGCSEFAAKMLFYRAKKTLRKQLSLNGLGKGSLLTALVLFGKMTAPSEAAAAQVTVTAASTEVGLLAGLVGLATSKTTIVSVATVGILSVGTIVATSGPEKVNTGNDPGPVGSSHIVSALGQATDGSEEYWYYFPEGASKPMMMRLKSNGNGDQPYCRLLQNDQANYYYHKNTVYINNHRMYARSLSVHRLPTDSPELSGFLSQVESSGDEMEYVPNKERGLLVIATRHKDQGTIHPWVTRHYNVLDEDYFRCDWPTGVRTIDNRDAMHKRGWTYFEVTGQINGERVSGVGRIPFVYATSKEHSPWLKLQVGNELSIVDSDAEAYVWGAGGAVAKYKGGSFFKGLARPWMGLHTIDMVRRDAAEERVWFQSRRTPDSSKAEVELTNEQVKLLYIVNLEADIIDKITFSIGGSSKGELRFSYLQNIDNVGAEFAKPRRKSYQERLEKSLGILWLVELAEGSLGKARSTKSEALNKFK